MHKHESQPKSVVVARDVTLGISILVLGCFFLSGLTGLVYEILWTRMIVKVIGSAPFAVSIVLTAFMGGLGVGSFLASRVIDRIEEPAKLLRIYALLELVIGGYGIVLPGLIIAFKPLYSILYGKLFSHFLLYNMLTLAGCVILLLIPVVCMGATLPVLCRFYIARLGHLGTRAGRLYALNTIGAAVGSLLCGFWLINYWGVWGALSFAVFINVLIGGACLVASYKMGVWSVRKGETVKGTREESPGEDISHKPLLSYSPSHAVGALFIFAISGFCAMSYEVIWTKLLGLIVGPTTYSFTIVLATFILGLALGSLLFGWLADKTKKPLWFLIFTQVGAAVLALVVSQLLGNSQFFFAKLIYHFKADFTQLNLIKAGILFVVMVGPTICLGATFPLVGKIYTQSLAGIGRSLGFAYAINTLGAVLGSFCAGFLLIPLLGKEQSLSVVVGIQLLTSFTVGGYLLWERRVFVMKWVTLSVALLVGLLCCFHFPHWNRQLLSMGRYHRFEDFSSELSGCGWIEALWRGPGILAKYQSNAKLLYYGDGMGGFTTVVKEVDALGTSEYLLINSGKGDASSRGDMPTQTLLAHLPMLFHPHPQEVMVVGLASGVTAGEVLHYPIERLDILEIGEQVVSASNFFVPWNNKVLSNPKTELIIQDGRAHLELSKRKYDVIISEPSNPWMAGLASLFTRECFLLARERLNEGGIFVQMFHSYQMDWPTFALVGRTFSEVFPESVLVDIFPSSEKLKVGTDYLMVGFKGGDRLKLENAVERVCYTRHSKNVVISDPRVLYNLIVSEDLQQLFGPGPVHSDNWPRLEFAAPKQMYASDPTIQRKVRSQGWLSEKTRAVLQEIADVEGQIAFASFALSLYQPFSGMVDLAKATAEQRGRFFEMVEDYCTRSLIYDYSIFTDQALKDRCLAIQIEAMQANLHLVADKSVVYRHLGDAYDTKGETEVAIEWYQKALASNPNLAEIHNNLGVAYRRQGMTDEAIAEYKKALTINPNHADIHNNLGRAYASKGELDRAIAEYKKALTINPNHANIHNNLGSAYVNKSELDKAIAEYKKALAVNPNHPEAHYNLGVVYDNKGVLDEAIAEYKKALAIKPNYAEAHTNLGLIYAKKGSLDKAISEYKQALTVKPSNTTIHYLLGNAYFKKGMLDEAISEYITTITLKPNFAKAHNNLSVAYYQRGNYKLALVHCDKAVSLGYRVSPKLLGLLKPYK